MVAIIHFSAYTLHFETILDVFKASGTIRSYEVLKGMRQIRIEPFMHQSLVRVSIILGQLPEISKHEIDYFKKQRLEKIDSHP